MTTKSTMLIGDLTALYSARSKDRKPINYELLDSVLKSSMNVDCFDENRFYTLYSDQNESQISFINGLKKLGWCIETTNPREVPKGMSWQKYRFDAQMAYQLGQEADRICLVTDSYELFPVLNALHKDDPNTEINLAFFSESLDGRWWKQLKEDSFIKFIDLDEKLYK